MTPCSQRPHEYSASLRVKSETLLLPDLVAALGEPSIGDRTSPRLPETTTRRYTQWSLDKASRDRALEEHIAELAMPLLDRVLRPFFPFFKGVERLLGVLDIAYYAFFVIALVVCVALGLR